MDPKSLEMTEIPPSPFRWTAIAAAEAARQRALSCQRRIEALRSGRPFDVENAQQARQSLEMARKRAAAAEVRRRSRVARLVVVKASTAGDDESQEPPGRIADRLREHRIAVSALFEQYFALGGEASLFDVDGQVHGVINLPSAQRSILEHALWELIELTAD